MDIMRCGVCDVLLDFDTWEMEGLCIKCYEELIFNREYLERKESCEGIK